MNPVSRRLRVFYQILRDGPTAQYVASAAAATPEACPMESEASLPQALEKKEPHTACVRETSPRGDSAALRELSRDETEKEADDNSVSTLRGQHTLDIITNIAGSGWVFASTMLLLTLWAVLGIVFGATEVWQVVIQDVSSIQCYLSDTLLMRQQQNSCQSLLLAICRIMSRLHSSEAMLRSLPPKRLAQLQERNREVIEMRTAEALVCEIPNTALPIDGYDVERDGHPVPASVAQAADSSLSSTPAAIVIKESFLDRISSWMAIILGSLASTVVFWAGILVWLGMGAQLDFSNEWQLYINTATAVELTFTSMFLQRIRHQHGRYLRRYLDEVERVDIEIERRLRRLTRWSEPNPVVRSQAPDMPRPWAVRIDRSIDTYAFVIGSIIGVAFSSLVGVGWIAAGNPMAWNANWWLIIGTYTGLVGFIDGFVLRNVYARELSLVNRHFVLLQEQDEGLLMLLGANNPTAITAATNSVNDRAGRKSLGLRISQAISRVCAMRSMSVGSVAVVIGLLAVATGLGWSVTAQLICNTPTMIVEGFLLLMLIQAHNAAEKDRRGQVQQILQRKTVVQKLVATLEEL